MCSRCKVEKFAGSFKKAAKRLSGLSSWCKSCHSEEVLKYQRRNRHKTLENKKRYRKTQKGIIATSKYKLGDSCREARRRYNPSDKGRAAQARWRNNRRDRSASSYNTLTDLEWKDILDSQSNKCNICGRDFDKSKILARPERDHIVPVCKGGALTRDNVQALCRSCNSRKGAKILPSHVFQS